MAARSRRQPTELAADPELFLLDPKNRPVLEGRRQLIKVEHALILGFLLLFVLVGLGLLMMVAREWHDDVSYWRSGVSSDGVVTKLWVDPNDDGPETYHVDYRYRLRPSADAALVGSDSISKAAYDQLRQDGRIQVRYLKRDVARSRTTDHEFGGSFAGLLLGAVLWNAFSWGMLVIAARGIAREGKLARGQVLRGELIEASGRTPYEADYTVTISYRFTSPGTKRRLRGTSSCVRRDLEDQSLPSPDTSIAVQYVDDDMHRAL